MDPNYASAGGGGGVGVGIGGAGGGSATSAVAAVAASGGRYNAAFYKDPLVSCQRSAPTPYSSYDPYGSSAGKVSSAYPYDAEAEFKERTGMGKTKVLAGNTVAANSAKIQHHQLAYNQNSCYGGSYSQGNIPESSNYYGYSYEQQQQNHPYTQHQQQQQQYHHQNQLQQQYKYNKLVAAQQQQQHQHQQQQHHQHQHQHIQQQQQKISQPEYGYTSYHHPYYHPHYHHPSSTQKGVAVMKTLPDASSSMPYVNSKMMTARAPQYPSSYTSSYHHHHPQSSYPPVVTAGHQHTYQSQSVCDDSRWMWNSSGGSDYPNSNCRSATYSGYVNGSGVTAKQQHNSLWSPHSMPIQYQSTGYPAAASAATVMAANQSCCPPPPPTAQSSTTTFYPQQYVKYPMHQSAADYNNDLYGNASQSNPASAAAAAAAAGAASGKVYTDLSGNSYQQGINSPMAYHHHQQQQQSTGEYSTSPSSSLDYSCSRYLQQQQQQQHQHQHQQQQQTESPSSLSSTSSSTSSYNHHYYHPYPTYSNVEAHQETYQQQVDTKIKSQSLRDFLTSWNEDEDEMGATTEGGPYIEQLHLTSDHFAQENNNNMGNAAPIMENHLQFKGSFSSSSRPKIHVGITVDSTVESDQYINLPDIIIDIEKSNKDIISLPAEDCLVANIPVMEKDDIFIKEEKKEHMPNIKDEDEEDVVVDKEKYPKKLQNHVQREKKTLRKKKKFQTSKILRTKQRLTIHHRQQTRMLKVFRRKKLICRRVKFESPPTAAASCSVVISQQYHNPKSLKCLCVSLINSEKFRKRILGTQSEIDNFLKHNNNKNKNLTISKIICNKPNTTTDRDVDAADDDTVDNEGNIDAAGIVAEPSSLLPSSSSPSSLSTSILSSSNSTSSSVIPKLSDLCKNALNSSFDRDVLVINLDEILDSDNLFVVQCDINENILENFIDETETEQLQQQQHQEENSNSSRNSNSNNNIKTSINQEAREEEEEDLVGILNDNNNNYNNSGSGSNSRDIFTPVPTDIERLKRCSSVTEVSNLPLDNSVEHDDFILTSINNPLVLQPPLTPPSKPFSQSSPAAAPAPALTAATTTDGSVSCPATLLCADDDVVDGRGHDRHHHSHSSSLSLIEQNCCLTQQQISVSSLSHNINNKNNENQNDENDNNQQLHEMLMLSGIVQQHDIKIINNNKDSKTFLPPTAVINKATTKARAISTTAIAAFDDDDDDDSSALLLLDSSKVVTTPSIHHEEIVPDNLKKFQNEKFLKYLHAKYVQGNLSEFYHANRIIKKYKKRIIKKLLNIVR